MGDRIVITAEELLAELCAEVGEPFDPRLDVTVTIVAERAHLPENQARDRLQKLVREGRLTRRTLIVDGHPRSVFRAVPEA